MSELKDFVAKVLYERDATVRAFCDKQEDVATLPESKIVKLLSVWSGVPTEEKRVCGFVRPNPPENAAS